MNWKNVLAFGSGLVCGAAMYEYGTGKLRTMVDEQRETIEDLEGIFGGNPFEMMEEIERFDGVEIDIEEVESDPFIFEGGVGDEHGPSWSRPDDQMGGHQGDTLDEFLNATGDEEFAEWMAHSQRQSELQMRDIIRHEAMTPEAVAEEMIPESFPTELVIPAVEETLDDLVQKGEARTNGNGRYIAE